MCLDLSLSLWLFETQLWREVLDHMKPGMYIYLLWAVASLSVCIRCTKTQYSDNNSTILLILPIARASAICAHFTWPACEFTEAQTRSDGRIDSGCGVDLEGVPRGSKGVISSQVSWPTTPITTYALKTMVWVSLAASWAILTSVKTVEWESVKELCTALKSINTSPTWQRPCTDAVNRN